jgi:ribbon-helix-helix CopG family protein
LTFQGKSAILFEAALWKATMKANHYSGVAVRLPDELRATLEKMATERGESLSLIIRDCLREATAARRGDQAVPQIAPDSRPAPTPGAFR